MNQPAPETVPFKAYARLLTMLGDQLIKNERIALVELIKNAYDADASCAHIDLREFSNDLQASDKSSIVIWDDGEGMSDDVLRYHWTRPATPVKLLGKEHSKTTAKGRLVQGEKGIGRFAILKLGKHVEIVTRPKGSANEYVLTLDLTPYDDDFLSEGGTRKDLFLADITAKLLTRPAQVIVPGTVTLGSRTLTRGETGTRITISNLRGTWNQKKIEGVYDDVLRLQSIFDRLLDQEGNTVLGKDAFEVLITRGTHLINTSEHQVKELRTLIEQRAALRITDGQYDEGKELFTFKINNRQQSLSLNDAEIRGLRMFRERFGKEGEVLDARGTSCGSFSFAFFVFDFSKDAPEKREVDKADRELIKRHRIYLYRDGIRVYPYGDPDDDWLHIDAYRGTISAGQFLSNDQVVGHVEISQTGNPKLRDKTNREGLIDIDDATGDFVCLLQSFLAWVRVHPYKDYRSGVKTRETHDAHNQDKIRQAFDSLEQAIGHDPAAQKTLATARRLYEAEQRYLTQRAETTEHLAGVGLSVETASHDILTMMGRAMTAIDSLIRESNGQGTIDKLRLREELSGMRGMLSFIDTQLRNLQQLFKSSKQRRKDIRVREVLDRVHKLFAGALQTQHIDFKIDAVGPPLVAKTTEAVLLQLFINLIDNAIYWLQTKPRGSRRILVTLDGDEHVLIFSDNGPGIKAEDAEYIFEPFYSGKGEEGRGLGLYIARQLLNRHEYSIALADLRSQRKLNGANFVVSFVREDE